MRGLPRRSTSEMQCDREVPRRGVLELHGVGVILAPRRECDAGPAVEGKAAPGPWRETGTPGARLIRYAIG
jgi:hypothetical protein